MERTFFASLWTAPETRRVGLYDKTTWRLSTGLIVTVAVTLLFIPAAISFIAIEAAFLTTSGDTLLSFCCVYQVKLTIELIGETSLFE